MADASPANDREFSLGRVLGRAFTTLGGNVVPLLVIALTFGAIPKALWEIAAAHFLGFDAYAFTMIALASQSVSLFIKLLVGVVMHAAVTRIVLDHATGERATVLQCLTTVGRALLPLFALAVLKWVGIMAGLAALIIPGVLIWVMWMVAAPALIAERRGVIGSLRRSANLTRGVRWPVFGLELAVLALSLVITAAINVFGLAMGVEDNLAGSFFSSIIVLSSVGTTLVTAVDATIQASLYVELREWKEGPVDTRLADIFA